MREDRLLPAFFRLEFSVEPMKLDEVREVIACLPEERTLFSYFRNRYAFLLLARALRETPGLSSLRRSPFSQLLEKPAVKEALAVVDARQLDASWAENCWPTEGVLDFVLTVSHWGCPKDRWYSQTSRRGYNLVLQLNLHAGAAARFAELVSDPEDYNFYGHPVLRRREGVFRLTLAWARLDLNFQTDEVLIEELQSDLVRVAEWRRRQHRDHSAVQSFLKPYKALWQEAMLTATLTFIWEELGLERVYFHEHRTGCALKRIDMAKPPRSLYEQLPRQFCMRRADRVPEFLLNDPFSRRVLKRIDQPRFYHLPTSRPLTRDDA